MAETEAPREAVSFPRGRSLMQELIERARCQAADARENAARAEDRGIEQEWLTLAVIFDELAYEYEQFSRILDERTRAA